LENVPRSEDEDVVPYSHAETERKTIKEERLEPFLKPEEIRNAYLLEVLVELWQLLFKYVIELVEVLL
jgi:hypothetical protein